MFDEKTRSRLKTVLYAVQFERDPLDGMERVFKTVLAPNILNVPMSEYADSIRTGLESSEQLSTLIAKNHSEPTIRRYLVKLLQKIEQRGGIASTATTSNASNAAPDAASSVTSNVAPSTAATTEPA